MRNVALFASQRSSQEFNQAWIIENEDKGEDIAAQFQTEEYREWYNSFVKPRLN